MKKRFIIVDPVTGKWIGSVFAERFEQQGDEADNDQKIGTFYTGSSVVAQVDTAIVTVHDSGGRVKAA